jgi:hypothetical protein
VSTPHPRSQVRGPCCNSTGVGLRELLVCAGCGLTQIRPCWGWLARCCLPLTYAGF